MDTSFKAAMAGKIKVAILLLTKGADPNVKGKYKETPLHLAVLRRHTDMVKLLIKHGADVNAKDLRGKTPLDYAKVEEIKKILLKAKAQSR